jgi:hypothetical protein
MVYDLTRQMTYYVVTFPDFYNYENNRVVIKNPRVPYYSRILAHRNLELLSGIRAPEYIYQAAISPAVCLEPSFSGKREGLMYLIRLESQGMPIECNKFLFSYEVIFRFDYEAIDFSRNIQLAYTEVFRQGILAEIQTRESLQEIHDEVRAMGFEIAKETVVDFAKDFFLEYFRDGTFSFDPRSVPFTIAKAILKVISKKILERI